MKNFLMIILILYFQVKSLLQVSHDDTQDFENVVKDTNKYREKKINRINSNYQNDSSGSLSQNYLYEDSNLEGAWQ